MKKKTGSILSCLCVGLIATAVGAVNLNEAAAEETAIFAMQAGASVRIDDDATQSGIRWNAVINETYWNSFKAENEITEETKVAFGSFVAPVENIDGELNETTEEVKLVECKDNEGNIISTPTFNADGLFKFYSTILYNDEKLTDYAKKAYATELVARSYIRVGEGETARYIPVDSMYREVNTEEGTVKEYGYAYENSLVTRSMQAVALAATQAGTATETQVGKYYGSTVITSEENSGYYSEADKTGSLTAAHAEVTSDFKAYVGALPVTISIAGETLTISGFTGLKAGKTYNLNLFSPDGTAYSQPFVYATKVIDDKQDLSYFTINDITTKTDAAGYVESATSFDGYYVLTQNIDASGYTHQVVSGTARENMKGLTYVGLYAQNGGLKGIFDGNGHTISNLTVGHHGLFGLICGGTVKNVGFTNVTLQGDTRQENLSFLAEQMIDGTIENVYIQANEIIGGDGTTNSAQSYGNRALLAIAAYGKTKIVNSVFTYDVEGTQKQYARSYGLIAYEHTARYNTKYPAGSSVTFENVYVISNAMISSWNTGGVYKTSSSETLAENEVDVTGCTLAEIKAAYQAYVYEKLGGASNENITLDTFTPGNIYCYKGICRYDTLSDMQAANNDYTAFENSPFWVVEEGEIPCFASSVVPTINVQGTYYLDMSEGKFTEEDTVSIFESPTAVIATAKIGETEYTVTNGKISGVPVSNSGTPVKMSFTLQGSETVYKVSVIPATKVIDEAADLDVFYLGDAVEASAHTLIKANEFNGYYVLTKDIDCTDYVHTITTNQKTQPWGPSFNKSGHGNIGLTGVFEGNGHTISNLSLNQRGLFGMIVGGTVQNVGFTNVAFTRDNPLGTSGGYHAQDSYALACVIEKATLKNVYVHIPNMAVTVTLSSGTISTNATNAVRNAGLAYTINGDTTMQNCVVKIDKYDYASTTQITDFGSLMCNADDAEGAYANVKDVYVISGVKLAGSNQSTTTQADAANQSESVTLSGVKRYATETEMKADAAANAASLATFSGEYWKVTDGVLSWGK